ncbi:tetratricopeptide repeat-containing protein [Streptomyces neyagawaensis]|uniref:tetratricopeptide repeat-containing protein n=1 Tax=Streptomyces neyagawaensis TaxID=42238 RepID=UPI0006E36E24|nr:tetratricopeptide repeat-containing protein [Streptomyces neyagawaensis]
MLPLDDAARILCDLAPDAGDLASARKVAERLGRLPLALTLAGSHLAHQLLESWSMDEYDRKLGEESTAIVDRGATGHGTGQSRHLVGRTWQLSLDTLASRGLPESTTLLRLLSLFAADPVPLTLLLPLARGELRIDGAEPALDPERLEPALRGLLDHSLAELVETDGVRCVQAHGVLLDSVAAGVPGRQRTPLAELGARLVEAGLPEWDDESAAARGRLAVLAPHASALLATVPNERTAALAVRVVGQVHAAGDFAGVQDLAPAVARQVADCLGGEHPVTLDARELEARALFRMGHYDESEALHRQVLDVRERLLGPDHMDTLRSCEGLLAPLLLLDRHTEAVGWGRRALDGYRRTLGEDSPQTLNVWADLIELLPHTDEERRYEEEGRALIAACERALPPDHPTTVRARQNYAWTLCTVHRYEEAWRLAPKVLADRVRSQGRDHPLALAALCLNAVAAHGLGRTAEAIGMLEELIERREGVLGPEHPFVVENREWLTEWRADAAS